MRTEHLTIEQKDECIGDFENIILDLLGHFKPGCDTPEVWAAHAVMSVWQGDIETLKLCQAWYGKHPEAISPVIFEKWIK